MSEHKDHISTYKSHIVVLLCLLLLTILTVTITSCHANSIRKSLNCSALLYAPEVRPKNIPVHGYTCTCYLLSCDHHYIF